MTSNEIKALEGGFVEASETEEEENIEFWVNTSMITAAVAGIGYAFYKFKQ